MLATDDVVRMRVVVSRWNECDRYAPHGHVFFTLRKVEQHRELCHHDRESNRVNTSVRRRIPIVEVSVLL